MQESYLKERYALAIYRRLPRQSPWQVLAGVRCCAVTMGGRQVVTAGKRAGTGRRGLESNVNTSVEY